LLSSSSSEYENVHGMRIDEESVSTNAVDFCEGNLFLISGSDGSVENRSESENI